MEDNSKPMMFLLIGAVLLILAFFNEALYQTNPEIFKPVYDFIQGIGTPILYIGGYFAVVIALFLWLPTWISVVLFVVLMFASGYYIKDGKGISLKIDETQVL
jgi:membrane protein implicated in regulation of membrane protease activity